MKNKNLLVLRAAVLLAIPVAVFASEPAMPEHVGQEIVTIELTKGEEASTLLYARDQVAPVVTMERWPGELRSEVPAETIELFGNGILRVTYPEFRIFEGTYVLELSQEDTHALLTELAASGIPTTDGREWKRQAEEVQRETFEEARRRGATEIVGHYTSDTLTVIRTRFFTEEQAQAPRRREQQQDEVAAHTFRYHGLATDAGRHREMEHLAAAANVEKRLLDLADQARAESAED